MDGRPAGRNNDNILHRLTNSTETAHRYRTDPEINFYTACHAHTTIWLGNSTEIHFWRQTDDLLHETTTKYRTDREIQAEQFVATAPTRKLIYSLHAMPYMMNWYGNSTGRHFLTTDRWHIGRNNDEICHWLTNSNRNSSSLQHWPGNKFIHCLPCPTRRMDMVIQPEEI